MTELERRSVQRWLRRSPVPGLPSESAAFALIVARWRIRERVRKRAPVALLVVMLAAVVISHYLHLNFRNYVFVQLGFVTCLVTTWDLPIRRAEVKLGTRLSRRLGDAAPRTATKLLGPTLLCISLALAFTQLVWVGVLLTRADDGKRLFAACVAVLVWVTVAQSVRAAVGRPALAFDDPTRQLDEWIRKNDAARECVPLATVSYLVLFVDGSPAVLFLVVASCALGVAVWAALVRARRRGLASVSPTHGGPVVFW